jgi:two-component system OmpR family sensor kinase
MLEQLRWRLTLWFIGLSIFLYLVLSIAVVLVFDSGLNSLLDDELRVVAREVRPTIDYKGGRPSLKTWAGKAKERDIELLATVQLYDSGGKLIEKYGPPGIERLAQGNTTVRDEQSGLTVRSRSVSLVVPGGDRSGFLQVQLLMHGKDATMRQLINTIGLLAPFLLIGLGVCGYFFAGKALKPTEESLSILRRFVADAGHEFTTPVSIILASVETLEMKLREKGMETDILLVISRAAERMAHLAKDLVILARMERPQSISPLTPVVITDLIKSVIEELEPAAKAKNIKVEMSDLQHIRIMAHADSLRTLFLNLLKNAINYTEYGGSVVIGLERIGGCIQIIIDDTGIGIPAESLERIFERFYRVDKSRSRDAGGSGLGLAIVNAIVQAHQGSIRVESTVGRGSRFTVTLPLRTKSSGPALIS